MTSMDSDLAERAIGALSRHPAVRSIRLVGSRAEGRATERSDWDFCIETDDFDALARELPVLLAPLAPLAQQWDRLGPFRCWMLVLPGPAKVELLFPDHPQEAAPHWVPTAENLVAIDSQFWDWALWASGKESAGKSELVRVELGMLFDHLLEPLGADVPPVSVADAIHTYRTARERAEDHFGVRVPRQLESEIVSSLRDSEPHRQIPSVP
jgi:Nucleotidyltransferase domain